MAQVSFLVRPGLTRITPTALVEKGRNHVTMLTGNAAFPTPSPTTAALTTACDTLDTANQAYDFNRGKTEKEARDAAFKDLRLMVRELAGYVQATCNNDKELIISTGFDVQRTSESLGLLPAAGNLRALVTPYPGKLELRWNGVRGRSLYRLEITQTDPLNPAGWSALAETGKYRYTADGLTSDKVYSFRVTVVGAAGPSPVSDIATAKAA